MAFNEEMNITLKIVDEQINNKTDQQFEKSSKRWALKPTNRNFPVLK